MLAVVCHDAGGAEIISSHIRQQGSNCVFVLEGPALNIFERKLGTIKILPLEDAICRAESVLCGTSWQSNLEFHAIRLAHAQGKRCVAFLDHWVNYRERFTRQGETFLPDEIWVGDTIAEAMAGNVFPDVTIRLVENAYFRDIRKELAAIPTRRTPRLDGITVLYVCEPIREHALGQFGDERYWGYVEEDALRYFLANIAVLGEPVEHILIRPHPSEEINKYNWAQHEFDLPIVQGGSRTLLEEMAGCDVVVGCESMAMVVGLLAGKRVISCIPPTSKRVCALPQPEIVSLHALLKGNRAVYKE